jgi:catechol 2,3-dioxygenase-like lactoylglutathione lyase family enzyme
VQLNHLALPVRDEERSRRFYEAYFGFHLGPAQRYDDGVLMLRNGEGFDLALKAGEEPTPLPRFLHFGFRLPHPEAVRRLLARVLEDGVDVVERSEEVQYVGFKCLDPAGYVVEAFWEPSPFSQGERRPNDQGIPPSRSPRR